MIDAFRALCQRSSIPLDAGWYAMVQILWPLDCWSNSLNTRHSNWLPWSIMTVSRGLNLDINTSAYVRLTVSALIFLRGTASGQREKRSINVKQYRNIWSSGKRLTMSIWTWWNLDSGAITCAGCNILCLVILGFWHLRQLLQNSEICLCIWGKTYCFLMIRTRTRALGYDNEWIFMTSLRKDAGMNGHKVSPETSQYNNTFSSSKKIFLRQIDHCELAIINSTFLSVYWAAAIIFSFISFMLFAKRQNLEDCDQSVFETHVFRGNTENIL